MFAERQQPCLPTFSHLRCHLPSPLTTSSACAYRAHAVVSPPQYAKSVEVTNESKESIKVTVTYDDHVKKADITQSEDIAAGKTFHFVERTMDGDNTGKFQVVAPVKHVQVDGHKLTPSVNGVVAKLGVKASGDAGSVKLAQH